MLHARAGYRCARPTPSISSDSACNARPVHTDGSFASISPRSRHFRSTPITGHIQSRSPSANKIMMMMVLLSMSAMMVSGDRQRLDGDAAALSLLSKGTTPSSDRQTELRLFLFVAL